MKIRVMDTNKGKIEAALDSVNGRSDTHCYTTYSEIVEIVEHAERQLAALLPQRTYRAGAKYVSESGGSVPHSYRYARTTTHVTVERSASGWFLVGVCRSSLWPNQCGTDRLILTPGQDKRALENFKRRYSVHG